MKKVTDDQKTHKNPALRASAPASVNKKPQVPVKTVGKAASAAPKKPPKIELEGKKWIVVSDTLFYFFNFCIISLRDVWPYGKRKHAIEYIFI